MNGYEIESWYGQPGECELQSDLSPRLRLAWSHYKFEADRVIGILDPTPIHHDHTLAYAVSVLHSSLQQSLLQEDRKRNRPFVIYYGLFQIIKLRQDELGGDEYSELESYYHRQTERTIRSSILNHLMVPRPLSSPEDQQRIDDVQSGFQSNARELAQIVQEGIYVRQRLLVRLPAAVELLCSNLTQLFALYPIPRPKNDL